VTALIAAYAGDGCVSRCDAKCYNAWGPECHCICRGGNHGAGKQEAIENTRELGESWLGHARAGGRDIAHAELVIGAVHEPLSECGGSVATIQGRNRHAVRETLAC
jgi:hypothetical protein